MKQIALLLVTSFLLFACTQKQQADLLVHNATIYTVDSTFSTVEAMVIKEGKILATGKVSDLEKEFDAKEKLDAGAYKAEAIPDMAEKA